jgi:NAD(P)-dependent dehydrogenase (short-subunit alcohol dehydrogenase family)
VAIVTGAGSRAVGDGVGVGSAVSIRFAREGASVCVMDVDRVHGEATLGKIVSEGGDAVLVVGDVTDEDACREAVTVAGSRWGGVNVLVNNAGISGGAGPVEAMDLGAWDRVLATNLRGALLMARHATPAMIDHGGGSIINMSSIGGLHAGGNLAYGPSKAGLIALTRELAVLHGRDGIRVNAIAPGHIQTPMVTGLGQRELRRLIAPLGIEGTVWDVAGVAVFLAGDDARFVTGTCIPVDGGVSIVGALAAHRRVSGQL